MINALYLIVTVGAVKTACIHIILLQLALIGCKCQYLSLYLHERNSFNEWMKKDLWPRIFIINFSYFLGDSFFYEIVSSLFTFWMLSDLVLLRYKLSEFFCYHLLLRAMSIYLDDSKDTLISNDLVWVGQFTEVKHLFHIWIGSVLYLR